MLKFEIIYSNADYLVANKSPLLPCHPLANPDGQTLIELVAKDFPEVIDEFSGDREGGLCHRIDNNTSGLVVIARNQAARNKARELFKCGGVQKTYLALVKGQVSDSLEIDIPVAHHPKNKKKMVTLISTKTRHRGKPQSAKTMAKVLLSNQEASLLRVSIGSGRRHQIRVHLASLGHPLYGDELYGGPAAKYLFGHALHAETVHFPNEEIVEAPCPTNWEDELLSLRLMASP